MRQVTPEEVRSPSLEHDPEVVAFRAQFDGRSPLDELVRRGAQQMLQSAIEEVVNTFLSEHASRCDATERRLVVRNVFNPTRQIHTAAGSLEVSQPRVRDNSPDKAERVRFHSSLLPTYLRRSRSIDELIPWLYLKGISTGDFSEALQALLGTNATALGPNVVVRLKEQWGQEYDTWCRRSFLRLPIASLLF